MKTATKSKQDKQQKYVTVNFIPDDPKWSRQIKAWLLAQPVASMRAALILNELQGLESLAFKDLRARILKEYRRAVLPSKIYEAVNSQNDTALMAGYLLGGLGAK